MKIKSKGVKDNENYILHYTQNQLPINFTLTKQLNKFLYKLNQKKKSYAQQKIHKYILASEHVLRDSSIILRKS